MLAELLVTFSVLYYCTLLLQPNAIKKKSLRKKIATISLWSCAVGPSSYPHDDVEL